MYEINCLVDFGTILSSKLKFSVLNLWYDVFSLEILLQRTGNSRSAHLWKRKNVVSLYKEFE